MTTEPTPDSELTLDDDQRTDFGTTTEDFDIDAWIDDWIDAGTRPRREITIYRDWGLLEEYERLAAQLPTDDASPALDEAMGDVSIQEQLDAIADRMEDSRLLITIERLNREEQKALAEKAPTKLVLDREGKPVRGRDGKPVTKVDEVALGDMVISAAIVGVYEPATGRKSSKMSAKQLRRMRQKIGDGPMRALDKGVVELNDVGPVLPSVPSSRER